MSNQTEAHKGLVLTSIITESVGRRIAQSAGRRLVWRSSYRQALGSHLQAVSCGIQKKSPEPDRRGYVDAQNHQRLVYCASVRAVYTGPR